MPERKTNNFFLHCVMLNPNGRGGGGNRNEAAGVHKIQSDEIEEVKVASR